MSDGECTSQTGSIVLAHFLILGMVGLFICIIWWGTQSVDEV